MGFFKNVIDLTANSSGNLYLCCPMLKLDSITITQFKNYPLSSFTFSERVIGICGLNGRGKTNLLDAIYYCCFTKSYFSRTDTLNIRFDTDGFRLESHFSKEGAAQKLVCIHRGVGKKELSLNDSAYDKMSQHIGKFPVVMIAPDDISLITGSSEERRRFIDTVQSQVDEDYLQQLIQYNKVLQQRNSLLKRFAEQGRTDAALLDVLDMQLAQPGQQIYEKRKAFTISILPLVQRFYSSIAGNTDELIEAAYESHLHTGTLDTLLAASRQRDLVSQRSNTGLHKDDIVFLLNGQPFKNIASQGQRKSLLFALKLAEFEWLSQHKGFPPILLLDDVFEKLDDNRMQQLLLRVCRENQGQVFITDTHKDRLEAAFRKMEVGYQLIEL